MPYDENYSDAANEADQDLLDQLGEDLMRLAELADAEADRLDAEVSAELDAHIQHPAITRPSTKHSLKRLTSKAVNSPLAQVINLADRRGGRD
ncbi:hypothetical protein [Mycolicibacterium sp.]|uniref:hypothetical protein n=1 Tax=Mycolicibacterium sp. TaxID=2320850 RepID=UPI0037CC74F2